MTIIRSFTAPFEMTDLTEELLLIPNTYGLVNQLGIFRDESVTQNNVSVESTGSTLALIPDQPRGSRNNVNVDRNRSIRSFHVPHFPLDDYLSPQDIQGKRAYGSDQAETQAAVMERQRIEREQKEQAELAERQQREAAEREARLIAEKEEAELRAQQAAVMERQRIEREQAAKEEADRKAEEARLANVEHMRSINQEILNKLCAIGLDEGQAKAVITAIARNQIPNVSIKY